MTAADIPPKVARIGTVSGDGAIVTPRLNITTPTVSRKAMARMVLIHLPEAGEILGLISGMSASPTAAAPSLTAIEGRR